MSETQRIEIESMAVFLDSNTTKPTGWGLGIIETNAGSLIFHYESHNESVSAWVVARPHNVLICYFHTLESLKSFINAIKVL